MAATAISPVGDYYKVLGINRSADDAAVKKAYRVNALKYHPEKNITPEAIKQFLAIGEAYDVLIDSKRRAIYDQYGPNGLRNGVAPRDGFEGFPGGYNYHGNPEETFSKFFGGTNPFSDFFAVHTSAPALNQKAGAPPTFGLKFGGLHGMNRSDGGNEGANGNPLDGPTQDPAVEHDLVLTLEELYLGTVKKLKVSRKTLTSDNITTTPTTKLLTLDVHRGWRTNTRITFPREGDQGPNKIPSDLTFIVKEAQHEFFKREGDDLIYTVHIPLSKALVGLIIEVKTLDGRVLKVPVNETVHPDYVKVISNEGMPISKSPEQRGKLLIKFVITFPTYLSEKQKSLLREALPG